MVHSYNHRKDVGESTRISFIRTKWFNEGGSIPDRAVLIGGVDIPVRVWWV